MPLPDLDYRTYQEKSSLESPAEVIVKISDLSLPLTLDPIPKGIWCGVAGTADVKDVEGNDVADFPFKLGLNPIRISQLRDLGTANDLWAFW